MKKKFTKEEYFVIEHSVLCIVSKILYCYPQILDIGSWLESSTK